MKRLIFFCLILAVFAFGQNPVYSEPPYPTEFDSIVVYFDASKGNQGLQGYSGTDVYAHAGLITEESESGSDWQYVWMPWPDGSNETQANTDANHLEKVSGDLWKLTIGYPHDYFSCPESEKIEQIAFVFRNADGSVEGKDEGNADIYLDFYDAGLTAVWIDPVVNSDFHTAERTPVFHEQSDPAPIELTASAAALSVELDSLVLFVNGNRITKTNNDTLRYSLSSSSLFSGMNYVSVTAYANSYSDDSDSLCIMSWTDNFQTRPAGLEDGMTVNPDNSVSFSLFAPGKEHVYLIGSMNDWTVDAAYQLKKEEENAQSAWFWITLPNAGSADMAYQYLVDGEIAIADPYSPLVLDPYNDQWVSHDVFPDLPEYPAGKTEFPVTYLDLDASEFTWTDAGYDRPSKDELVIYELLIRDFSDEHSFQSLIDSMDYFKRLGVTAIELMPVNEFDGNESWGYNPSFYFAPDKYYGTPQKLKEFVNCCHENGMAVLLDMVLNHATGQSPMVRLYNEGDYGSPTSDNPWYNTAAKHPFNVFNDMNHESLATKYFVDRVNKYWIEEYHIDGYRYDLSKGFTQTYSGDNVAYWGQYDQSRVNILTRMANQLWSVDSGAYVILEHFSDNSEETVLANNGMMLWGNMNHNYGEASMGWLGNSDFSWVYHGSRGWSHAHAVGYMESHDEERLAYNNSEFGNNNLSYSIRSLSTNMDRLELVSLFFLTIPGPKMIWQFGELGYDYSIDYNGRTGNKPIRWDYYQDEDRKDLYDFYSILNFLRSEYSVFTDEASYVDLNVGNNVAAKRIKLSGIGLNVVILGNFDIITQTVDPGFHHSGPWYDYFSGDTLQVSNVNETISLEPGEYKLYTDQKLVESPVRVYSADMPAYFSLTQNYPNPFNPTTRFSYSLPEDGAVRISVYDMNGKRIKTLVNAVQPRGYYEVNLDMRDKASGIYIVRMESGKFAASRKMLLIK